MNINSFATYKVKLCNQYSYIYNEEFGEYSYAEEKEEWEKTMEGGEFMELIGKFLLDEETISIEEEDSKLAITTFDPWNGTGANIVVEYQELKKK